MPEPSQANPNRPDHGPRSPSEDGEEKRFPGISPERWLELARHYAEIQRYQKEHHLEDQGDPPPV